MMPLIRNSQMTPISLGLVDGAFPTPSQYDEFDTTIIECLNDFKTRCKHPITVDIRYLDGLNPKIRDMFPTMTFVSWPVDGNKAIELEAQTLANGELAPQGYVVCVPFLDPSLFLRVLGNIWKIIAIHPQIKEYGLCLHLSPLPKPITLTNDQVVKISLPAGKVFRPKASNKQVIWCVGDDIWSNAHDVGVSYQALFV
jgi:hypothetical protein